MPIQDKSRPDRKVKRRRIVCEETERMFDDVFALADHLDRSVPYCYNIIKRHQPVNGQHYLWERREAL